MKIYKSNELLFVVTILISLFVLSHQNEFNSHLLKKQIRTSSPKAPLKLKKERAEYFFNMLRDPATNRIPADIRHKELEYAKGLPKKNKLAKTSAVDFIWKEAGPNDVGGRTRALAVDVNNPNTIIAGAASGGLWKSTDNGNSWIYEESSPDIYSISSLAQDPRAGHTNTWYASTGEWRGASASDRGYTAWYSGNGLYKSTDNGNTWQLIPGTNSDPTKWNSMYDYVSKITVSPTTGSVFLASNGFGIVKSSAGGSAFSLALGNANDHYYSDVIVLSNGTIIAVLSQSGYNSTKKNAPGVYKSTDDGSTWNNITPTTFPSSHERSVLAAPVSNPNIIYVFTNTGNTNSNGDEDLRLNKINLTDGTSTDLSGNLPTFSETGGTLNTQSNYNMVIAVKPDNPNFVLIGGTSLFRSTDGVGSPLNNKKQNWIGGYHPTNFFYPNHHPDQHVIAFDPTDPNKMWSGHDGGLSYTTDIRDTTFANFFPWIDKNNGYNVTQYFTVAIHKNAGDNRLLGGTQDNGSPYFRLVDGSDAASEDISSGDGAFCYLGTLNDHAYVSTPNGSVMRLTYDGNGNPYNPITDGIGWSVVSPSNASNQLFINPFIIDPNNEDIMYYPAGNTLWRNTSLSNIPNFQQNGTSAGWSQLTNLTVPTGYNITAMNVSTSNTQFVLYYGAYNKNGTPKIFRLDNANTATTGAVDISIQGAASGAYVHYIAVNPENGNEIVVVFSNYNIDGLFHSTDGGASYISIEGNLTGDGVKPGPSLRACTILPTSGGIAYLVGTSTGLYSTTNLNGSNTVWVQESADKIQNSVVEDVTSRTSDNYVAVGTHGRGIFVGSLNGVVGTKEAKTNVPTNFSLSQNYPNPFNPTTIIHYSLANSAKVTLKVYDILGNLVQTLANELQSAGNHVVNFNGTNLASGLYIYRLQAQNTENKEALFFEQSRKMLLIK